ncbi:MAG: cytochrome-c peroxidase [Planctomycetota bacterium]|nr:MAG: cytochrome-c peroxidase [Planctomycetota bacterium]
MPYGVVPVNIPIMSVRKEPMNAQKSFSGLFAAIAAAIVCSAFGVVASADPGPAGAKLEPLGPVPVPADNPMTPEKIELGRMLYFDPRLSGDSSLSCAKCHDPSKGFSNGVQLSDAYPGTKHWRHVPTVLNAAYAKFQFWDGRADSLEAQAVGPIAAPIEMNQNYTHLVEKLSGIPHYRDQFKKVFNSDVTMDNLAKAIAAFERTIVSKPGKVDKYLSGDKSALTDSEKRGMELFTGKANCIACHHGALLTDNEFHTTGVPEIEPLQKEADRIATRHFFATDQKYPNPRSVDADYGREFITKSQSDRGKFKTPSLRELKYTAPYMHNGAFETLEDVIEFYMKGGGDHKNKDALLKPFDLTDQEFDDLLAFLEALSSPTPITAEKPAELPKKSDGTL